MRLDHLLSKETSNRLRLVGNILVSWCARKCKATGVTLFNLEGTGPKKGQKLSRKIETKPNEVGLARGGDATERVRFHRKMEANDAKFAATRAHSSAG